MKMDKEKSKVQQLSDEELEKVSGGYVSVVYSEGTVFNNIKCSDLVVKIKYAIYIDPNNNNNNRYKVDYWDYRQSSISVEKEYTHQELRDDGFRSTL